MQKNYDQWNALRIACLMWKDAYDKKYDTSFIADKGDECKNHRFLTLKFASLEQDWRAIALQISGFNYDFVNDIGRNLGTDECTPFSVFLKAKLIAYGFKEAPLMKTRNKKGGRK